MLRVLVDNLAQPHSDQVRLVCLNVVARVSVLQLEVVLAQNILSVLMLLVHHKHVVGVVLDAVMLVRVLLLAIFVKTLLSQKYLACELRFELLDRRKSADRGLLFGRLLLSFRLLERFDGLFGALEQVWVDEVVLCELTLMLVEAH